MKGSFARMQGLSLVHICSHSHMLRKKQPWYLYTLLAAFFSKCLRCNRSSSASFCQLGSTIMNLHYGYASRDQVRILALIFLWFIPMLAVAVIISRRSFRPLSHRIPHFDSACRFLRLNDILAQV